MRSIRTIVVMSVGFVSVFYSRDNIPIRPCMALAPTVFPYSQQTRNRTSQPYLQRPEASRAEHSHFCELATRAYVPRRLRLTGSCCGVGLGASGLRVWPGGRRGAGLGMPSRLSL